MRYEERELQLSHLTALDFYISYFTEGPVGHTFVSFIFDNAPPLSISIETRPYGPAERDDDRDEPAKRPEQEAAKRTHWLLSLFHSAERTHIGAAVRKGEKV